VFIMFLYTPEAGLHWDGEQARIVDVVRRRQQALQQLIYHEQGTFEWLEEMLASAGNRRTSHQRYSTANGVERSE